MSAKREALPVETVALSSLKPHPKNYRTHPDDQLDHIGKSIEEHGFYRNVVVARDSTILAGHGVVEAAKKLGRRRIPVVRVDLDADDPRALKLLVADNELGHLAEVDDRALTELLRGARESAPGGLLGTGYDDTMLAGLTYVTRDESEIADRVEAAQWVGLPEYDGGTSGIVLVLHFDSEEDRAKLIKKLGLKMSQMRRKTWSAWWPPRDRVSPREKWVVDDDA